ncbi:F4 family fimbrial subunit [Vibrio panuliri]|uniref:Uncharacterized protein n=1 Tax=Vibrio panuliri TaxID=1381081 RepID=A0ABX3F6Q9_9VIBR|nr:hypothetical protein [Vibrio panuliri]KAB1457264.1 hypothetical protein F7O85_05845 [Vibrio panuliri]OLQ84737.1 hypothetical protein BIY20_17110 [Vibrio panuliri]
MKKKRLFLWLLLGATAVPAETKQFVMPSDIEFSGSVLETAPNWLWQLEPTTRAWATDWFAVENEATRDGEAFVFNYAVKNAKGRAALVLGYMKSDASTGRRGLAPEVSIVDINGASVVLNGNIVKQRISIEALGKTKDERTVKGALSFSVESAFGALYKRKGVTDKFFAEAYNNSIGWAAFSLIRWYLGDYINDEYRFNEAGKMMNETYIRPESSVSIEAIIDGTREPTVICDVIGSFTSHLSEVSTRWIEVPKTWTASMTINVRMK